MNDDAASEVDITDESMVRLMSTDQLRDLAYQYWAFVDHRNCATVAKRIGVSERTVYRWVNEHSWNDKLRKDLVAIMPDLVEQTANNLHIAAHQASIRLAELSRRSNERDGMTKEEQFEMKALQVPVVLGGFSPVGQNKMPAPTGALAPDPDEPALSLPERIARHHARIGGGT